MKKNKRIMSRLQLKTLKTLTEDFLDKGNNEIHDYIPIDKDVLRYMTQKIDNILSPPRHSGEDFDESAIKDEDVLHDMTQKIDNILSPPRPPREDFDEPDITDKDREDWLTFLHGHLKPLWDKLKSKIFEFQRSEIPRRESSDDPMKSLETDPSAPYVEYECLTGCQLPDIYYDINISKPKSPKNMTKKYDVITIQFNFDDGKIHLIRKDHDLVNNLLTYLQDIPLNVFAKCEYCGNFIIVTRADRKCCSTKCAAGLNQRKKWEDDPVGCREREKARNRLRKEKKGTPQ